jgi:hypothetical protein
MEQNGGPKNKATLPFDIWQRSSKHVREMTVSSTKDAKKIWYSHIED